MSFLLLSNGNKLALSVGGDLLLSPIIPPPNPPQLRGLLHAGVPMRGVSELTIGLMGVANAGVPLRGGV